jgi:2-phosphoglycerate kinase
VVTGVRALEAAAEKAKGEMQSRAEQHILITGACGAGKSTLGKALSRQLQLPLHRLDDNPDFRQMLQHDPLPGVTKSTGPQWYAQWYARWQALRRHLVDEAVKLPQPHIIEGTHILAATAGEDQCGPCLDIEDTHSER